MIYPALYDMKLVIGIGVV